MAFKIGDVVKHKTGGPIMCILLVPRWQSRWIPHRTYNEGDWICRWLEGDILHTELFAESELINCNILYRWIKFKENYLKSNKSEI